MELLLDVHLKNAPFLGLESEYTQLEWLYSGLQMCCSKYIY